MRIFYASGTSPNANVISQSNLWKNNLFDSLVEMGHEVIPFSRDVTWHFTTYKNYKTSLAQRRKFNQYRSELQSALIAEISNEQRKKNIDLFFSYFWSEICSPETIDRIRSLGIKTVNWYCNGSYQFDLVAELAPHFDWCLVPEMFRMKDYLAVGAHPIYCQEAANPQIYKAYDVPQEFDVTFIGQAYGDRPLYVRYLLDQGIEPRVWGHGWENFSDEGTVTAQRMRDIGRTLSTPEGWWAAGKKMWKALNPRKKAPAGFHVSNARLPRRLLGGILPDQEMIRMFSRSKINLGFSTCGDTHETMDRILQVRLRDFEVPMSGGFYMVEHMEELEEFFRIGEEVVCYTGPKDLAEKIRYYLAHDGEREAIRKAGHERCLRDHTWTKRFEAAFKEMGLA